MVIIEITMLIVACVRARPNKTAVNVDVTFELFLINDVLDFMSNFIHLIICFHALFVEIVVVSFKT
jgi:hypothetical protein